MPRLILVCNICFIKIYWEKKNCYFGTSDQISEFCLYSYNINNLRLFSTHPIQFPIFEQTSPICWLYVFSLMWNRWFNLKETETGFSEWLQRNHKIILFILFLFFEKKCFISKNVYKLNVSKYISIRSVSLGSFSFLLFFL